MMNRPELLKRTQDVLYNAYFNDSLKHANCSYCAVGNMIEAATGEEAASYEDSSLINKVHWGFVFSTKYSPVAGKYKQKLDMGHYYGRVREQIEATGYELPELMRIEYAFESCEQSMDKDEWMFNGLAAVLAVLDEIHEVKENDSMDRFRKHYESKLQAA